MIKLYIYNKSIPDPLEITVDKLKTALKCALIYSFQFRKLNLYRISIWLITPKFLHKLSDVRSDY